MSADLESSLRDAFRQGADALPHTVDPWTRTTSAVRRSQTRRRTAALAVAASVLVVGVGVVTTGVPSLRADRGQVARTPDAGDVQVTTDDVATWPLRGELARDADFIALARESLVDSATVDRLLYAGRVGDRRVALALVTRTEDGAQSQEVRAAVEPANSTGPSGWQGMGYPVAGIEGVVSLALQGADGSVDLLVLSRTDTRAVAYSRAATYDDRARPQRTYVRLAPRGGVAVAHLEPGPVFTLSVRVDRISSSAAPAAVQLVSPSVLSPGPDEAAVAAAAGDQRCAGSLTAGDVKNAVVNVANNRDPLRAPAAVEAVWCRDVDGGVVGLFGVTLQDGSTYQAQLLEARTATSTSTITDFGRPVPRGAARTTPLVLRDIPREGSVPFQEYYVNAPGAASVDIVVDDGSGPAVLTRVRPDRDGFARVRLTQGQSRRLVGATVGEAVLRDAAGKETGRTPMASAEQTQDLDWSVDGPLS
jgi:hypothetical protein